jgi:uncharacterized protein DUF5681
MPSLALPSLFCYAERGSVAWNGKLGIHWSLALQSNAVEKGQSGNPLGRLPGEKQFADQLRIVLAEPVDKNDPKSVRKMRRIAEKLVECAMKGEGWAISQVADRIDGKATAEIQTEQRHRYVIEAPAQLTREQWIAKYSPTPEAIPASPPTITQ